MDDDGDCAPDDPNLWSPPPEARDLRFASDDAGVLLTWSDPALPSATTVRHDTLRTAGPFSFEAAACIETDGVDRVSRDDGAGAPVSYLVRSRIGSPLGLGTLGTRSDGARRAGVPCP